PGRTRRRVRDRRAGLRPGERLTMEHQDIADGQVETTTSDEERRAHHAAAMMLVRQYPDPVLRVPADAVREVNGDVKRLVERMTDVMRQSHGVGLAAPQLGILRRVLVYRVSSDGDVHVLINPE